MLQDAKRYVEEIIVDGEVRYACKICGSQYKNLLVCYHNHVKGKHLGKCFICSYCPYKSYRKGNIQTHIQRKHQPFK